MRVHFASYTFAATFILGLLAQAQTDVNCQLTRFQAPAGSGLTNPLGGSAINRWGNIVGRDAAGRPFIRYTDGRVTRLQLNLPAGAELYQLGKRNASGVTVGTFRASNGRLRGFIDNGNTTTLYDYPGSEHTSLVGINQYGTILGQFFVGSTPGIFVLRNGKATRLNVPLEVGGPGATPVAISDTGVIVGTWVVDSSNPPVFTTHGWIYANGTFRDFAFPGAEVTVITDINARGTIVGVTDYPTGGFIYKNGQLYRTRGTMPNGTPYSPGLAGVNGYDVVVAGNLVGRCNIP